MKDGFIKVAAITPNIKVADCIYNTEKILEKVHELSKLHVKIMVFPELSITGYTVHDLFLQDVLLEEARNNLIKICNETASIDAVLFIGLPLEVKSKLYNVCAVLHKGKILGFVPKHYLPTYGEFYEGRHFAKGKPEYEMIRFNGQDIPFGMNLLFTCENMEHVVLSAELCEDLWVPCPPSTFHALNGATIIANLSASNEMVGKTNYRQNLVSLHSARLICGYIYASAGRGESTQDLVFGGHKLISENGSILAESKPFTDDVIISEIDVNRLSFERRKMSTYSSGSFDFPNYDCDNNNYCNIYFSFEKEETALSRQYDKHPFVPGNIQLRNERCEEILKMQAMGLVKRIEHIGIKTVTLGISGGLDSTLALLVCARAFDILGLDRSGIISVTMPAFGTTDRTYNNACKLTNTLGATLKEIPISDSVIQHFKDIGQDINVHDVTYENGQARERTQVLMDVANKTGGIVIGTGDLSELALGWATYNGDHMSMYGVNASIPKTLVRYLVGYYADTCGNDELAFILRDILDTPVSPELLPPEDGKISQKTEDIVGPYELHDFYLYYSLRAGFTPEKTFRIASRTFEGDYDEETLLKWLKNFYRRFFSQQFKRSCLPDGPKVGSVALSPRGDLRMPSDASSRIWMDRL